MSSQKVDANEEVEKIADGDFGTKWTSEAGTFPNWVEIRWPQPVALNKLVVDEDPAGRSGQFRVDAFLDDGWKTLVGPTVNVTPSGRTVTFGPVVATRIRLRIKPEATLLPGHVLARNISPGHVLVAHPWEYDTTPYAIGPMFYVHDARAEPLGTYTYNRTRVAYAAKTVRGARSIYLGVPYLDSVVLRQICRVAGVHLYAREDAYVDASQNYLMIAGGPSGFNADVPLPRARYVYDIDHGAVVGSGLTSFHVAVPANQTAIFYVAPDGAGNPFTTSSPVREDGR